MNFNQILHKLKENGTDYHEVRAKSTPIAMVAPEVKQNTDDTEITKTCAIAGCEDYKNLEPDSFLRFPEEPGLRQVWADLTGRPDWTPTDYSYICVHHFSTDSFVSDGDGMVMLSAKAVPSLKLPGHVFEVEYIDEETLENDELDYNNEEGYEMELMDEEEEEAEEKPTYQKQQYTESKMDNIETLKLFTEVQKMQREAVGLKDKLKCNMKLHNQQAKYLQRLKDSIEIKQKLLNQKKKKKSRILLSIQDKIKDDTNGLVLAMPTKHTEDSKNFALSLYKYSPQAYIYARNTLRTMLPCTDVLESWLQTGCQPKNVLSDNNVVKVTAEQTDTELTCKIAFH